MPGPGTVQLKGAFDKNSKAFSFGLAREHFKKVFFKEGAIVDPVVPGPGRYQVPSSIGKEI